MAGGGGGGDSEFEVGLNLVALIDILTNLLFFLLVGFAEPAFDVGKIRLPYSSTKSEMAETVSILLSEEGLEVDHVAVAKMNGNKIDAPMEGDKIVPLYEKLTALKAARKTESAGLGKNDDVIFFVADREIPFETMSPVMKTAAMAGFPNFRFAVARKGD